MYSKKPVAKYQYNDPEPAELAQVLSPEHTALIIIDMQNDFASDKGKFALGGRDSTAVKSIIPACQRLLMAARNAGVFVVHIQQTTLPDGQSDNGGWLAFKTRDGKSPTYGEIGSWGWEHVDELKPCGGEPVVTKFRPDAFLNTPLDMLLHSNKIESVVCCGCTTEGCVMATVMGAAFHDYYTCVAEDAVATSVDGAHEHAIWLMKKRYIVRNVEEIIGCWQKH
ncbi:cysteine hydrolase family protein [Yanshouia hominis]|uniref:Cysteine hydrolase n=1 Tax=Yanshouia hominis TaxID=2763673 RepID=A0ABR7NI67_9FIRM|nr:isochorismatase family cysteine hydrolase [Yanshouia hominis]MBC8576098.1 cysteine hydrolase [Yanshouia hominis]